MEVSYCKLCFLSNSHKYENKQFAWQNKCYCLHKIGNDLWALGCTLYQMLSGISPFKDGSEWLTFQRIMDRDFKFPEYFSSEAFGTLLIVCWIS
jgi:serine/threonine protein kinase